MPQLTDDAVLCLHLLARQLKDLLCWATHPHPEPLGSDWWTAVTDNIRRQISYTLEAVGPLDGQLAKRIKKAQRLASEFAALLCDRPWLSTVPIENWTVPKYRQLFDDLAELEREFEQLGDFDLPSEVPSRQSKNVLNDALWNAARERDTLDSIFREWIVTRESGADGSALVETLCDFLRSMRPSLGIGRTDSLIDEARSFAMRHQFGAVVDIELDELEAARNELIVSASPGTLYDTTTKKTSVEFPSSLHTDRLDDAIARLRKRVAAFDVSNRGLVVHDSAAPVKLEADTRVRGSDERPATQDNWAGKKTSATVNSRMIDLLDRNPESKDWSARQFAIALNCSKGSIGETAAWRTLMKTRESAKAELRKRTTVKDRRGKRRPK